MLGRPNRYAIWISLILIVLLIPVFSNHLTHHRSGWRSIEEKTPGDTSPKIRVNFISVSHGDSIFVEFPNGRNMLVDTGKRNKARKYVFPVLRNKKIRQIDTLVLTHNHYDHIGSADEVIRTYPIGEIWYNGESSDSKYYRRYLNEVRKKKVPYRHVKMDEKYYEGETEIHILNSGRGQEEENDNSVAFRIEYQNFSMLFSGDIEHEATERMFRRYGSRLQSRVYKLTHHGSQKFYEPFVRAVEPEVAVNSSGFWWGFPHSDTEALLEEMNVPLYDTHEHGSFVVVSNGDWIRLRLKK